MTDLEPLLQNITSLTPFTVALVALVALAGLVVGVAPSSFPLISVAAGLSAGQNAARTDGRWAGIWRPVGFALGIASVDMMLGALFGLLGFAVLRVLVQYLAVAYALLAVMLIVTGLALLGVIHIVVPLFNPSARPAKSFVGSFLLGLPFGLSTCPACTPLLLPVVAAAAGSADPLMGAVLMATFGIARGVPIVIAGSLAGAATQCSRTRHLTRLVERGGAVLMFAAAAYFTYQSFYYAGWLGG